jgi:hypothetical protein
MEHNVRLELLDAQAHVLPGHQSAGAIGVDQRRADFDQQPAALQLFHDEGVKFLSEFQRWQHAGCAMLGNQLARYPAVAHRGDLLPFGEWRGDGFGRVDSHSFIIGTLGRTVYPEGAANCVAIPAR